THFCSSHSLSVLLAIIMREDSLLHSLFFLIRSFTSLCTHSLNSLTSLAQYAMNYYLSRRLAHELVLSLAHSLAAAEPAPPTPSEKKATAAEVSLLSSDRL